MASGHVPRFEKGSGNVGRGTGKVAEPSADHTVFVHVKQVEAERAPWLAAQVGLTVIGDLVMAPY